MAFMVVVSLLIVTNVYWLCRELKVGRWTAFAVGLAFGVGTPVLTYSSMTFVEPIGALVCVYVLRVLHQGRLRTRHLLLVSASLGVLPWVHSRFLLFPVVFLTFLLIRLAREEGWRARRLLCATGPAALLFLGFEAYNLAVWHTLDVAPNQMNAGAVPFQNDPLPALAGIVLDQEVGFLVNFPIFLLVLPGVLFAASRRWAWLHVHVAAAVVPYTLMIFFISSVARGVVTAGPVHGRRAAHAGRLPRGGSAARARRVRLRARVCRRRLRGGSDDAGGLHARRRFLGPARPERSARLPPTADRDRPDPDRALRGGRRAAGALHGLDGRSDRHRHPHAGARPRPVRRNGYVHCAVDCGGSAADSDTASPAS